MMQPLMNWISTCKQKLSLDWSWFGKYVLQLDFHSNSMIKPPIGALQTPLPPCKKLKRINRGTQRKTKLSVWRNLETCFRQFDFCWNWLTINPPNQYIKIFKLKEEDIENIVFQMDFHYRRIRLWPAMWKHKEDEEDAK